MTTSTFCCLAGTDRGAFRVSARGDVTPIGLSGVRVQTLSPSPTGDLLAAIASGEVWRWSAKETRWMMSTLPGAADPVECWVRLSIARPAWFAATRAGSVLKSIDEGQSFKRFLRARTGDAVAGHAKNVAPQLVAIPDRPEHFAMVRGEPCVEIAHAETGEVERLPAPSALHHLAIHPREHELWFATSDRSLLRSNDHGQNWTLVAPLALRSCNLTIERWSPYRLLVLGTRATGDGAGASTGFSIWNDAERDLMVLPPHEVDHRRDPTGEITSAGLPPPPSEPSILYATDRGEIVQLFPATLRTEIVASDLPPIRMLLCTSPDVLDPSRSGVYMLP